MRNNIGRLFLAAGTAATLVAMPLASHASTIDARTVFVSEIGWAGSSLSSVDEWLELTNLTDDAIDLSGWTVTGAAASNGSLAIPSGKSIPPHSTFLISNYDQDNAKSSLARAPDLVTASVSLSNSALGLGLVDASGTVRDQAGSGGAPMAGRVGGGAQSPGVGFASMVRLAPVEDGALAESWATAMGSDGFDADAAELGTPGTVEGWFVPVQVAAPEPEPAVVAVPIVENATTATTDAVPVPASEPIPTGAEPPATEIPLSPEPDATVAPPDPTTTDTATPAIDPIPTVEIVAEQPAVTTEAVETKPEILPAGDPTPIVETPVAVAEATPVDDPTPASADPIEIDAGQVVTATEETAAVVVPEAIVELPVEVTMPEVTETTSPTVVENAAVTAGPVDVETIATAAEATIVVSPATTPVQMVSISPTVSSFPPGTLLLNEFVSDATAEWIEILNPFNNVIDLSGWTVRDATGKATALPDQLLGLGQFAVVTNPSGKLNNDGDTIELLDPSGSVADAVTYGTGGETIPKAPDALARNAGGEWAVTSVPTPGAENRFDAEETAVPSASTAAAETVEPIAEQPAASIVSPPPSEEGPGVVIASSTATTLATPEPVVAEPTVDPVVELPGPTTLRLFEIYPNATGDDSAEEFVAIENFGTGAVDLRGWSLADASGKTFSPSDPTPIEPGATLVLSRDTTKIVLNNTSDSVTLTAPDGTLIDSISYDSPPIGSILRLQNSNWVWSGDVAGAKPGAVSTGVAPAPSAPVAPASASRGSVSHAKVSGTVLVAPGVLGTQIFYVDDGDGGIQVYKNDADFPDLKEGDVVTVTGTTSEVRGEERLKVGKADSISVTGSAQPETAEAMAIADVSEKDHGRLVRVAGIVLVRSGSHATLEDHGAQIAIRVAEGTGIDAAVFARNASVEVTGILVASNGTLTLLPRSPDDVTVIPTETTGAAAATVSTGKAAQTSGDRQAAGIISAGTLLALLAFAGRKLIPAWNQYAKARALRVAASAAH